MARTRKSDLGRTSILQTPSIRLLEGAKMPGVIRTAWTVALVLTTAAALVAEGQGQRTFRAGVDVVSFGLGVVDKQGKPVTGLTADDFQIVENGKPQALAFFAAGQPQEAPPLHLGLLLDTSGSMADDLKDARSAAVKFVNALDRAVDVTLVDFATEVRVARFGPDDRSEERRVGKECRC